MAGPCSVVETCCSSVRIQVLVHSTATKLHGLCNPPIKIALETLRTDLADSLTILTNNIRKLRFQESMSQEINWSVIEEDNKPQTLTFPHILFTSLCPQNANMLTKSTST